ncbi:hypothetical protein U9M48_008396 [Paspalum notatum var. saurae]
MSQEQHERIGNEESGGLLDIACRKVPIDFACWLMVDCYDAETREFVQQERGMIPVNAEAVHNVLGLRRGDDRVRYEYGLDALNFINEAYQLQNGEAPKINTILQLIWNKEGADDEFFRSWLMLKGPGIRGHSLFRMDDITRFVSSWLHNGISLQIRTSDLSSFFSFLVSNKRKLSQALGEVCVGFTDLMGKFLDKVSEVNASSAPQSSHTAPESSNAQRQTKTKHQRTSTWQPHLEHNGDSEEDSEGDSDYVMESEEDSDTEKESEAEDYETKEESEAEETKVQNGDAGQGENNPVSANEGTDEYHIPLITRWRRIGKENNKEGHIPLMVVPPDKDNPPVTSNNSLEDKGKDVIARRAKLKLLWGRDGEDETCPNFSASKGYKAANDMMIGKQDVQDIGSSRKRDRPLDFTPPDINLMKFVECDDEQTPSKPQDDTTSKQAETFLHDESAYSNFFEQIDKSLLREIEDNAIRVINMKKSKERNIQASSSKRNNNTVVEPSELAARITPSAATDPSSVKLSVTPAYRPPNIMLKVPAVLRSPFLDTAPNRFKCSKLVCELYNAVCASGERSTRSTSFRITADYDCGFHMLLHAEYWDGHSVLNFEQGSC